ncbi:hypothetical protein [Bradyrhizobium sp. CB1015]|uniref:hypothetical protein n=1 Tax=Bradyrhizobium sp. CB1015 TaxID=2976822 RepID=UPI0021AB0714|nr:hypothetical protein [Bradyrhizobium sp. CB1015]UWU94631.1 hypothetical protein N2604_12645 [Bradyrhizobium sp. CB1015]
MLPGFRFLFAAILLSTSILVFGLGTAALLRATHQQYVSNPGWRNGPQEQVFAQAPEPAQPVLAVLRAEPEPPAETTPSLRDQVPTIALPLSEPEQVAALATETDGQPEAAAPPAEVPAIEPTKPEPTVAAAAPASTDTLTAADTTAAIPEAQPTATASEPAPVDPTAALAAAAIDVASARLAALNAATVANDAPAKVKAESTKSDSKATKRKAKAKKRQRVVRRPPPQQLQQQLDPFGQQQPAFATTTTARTR